MYEGCCEEIAVTLLIVIMNILVMYLLLIQLKSYYSQSMKLLNPSVLEKLFLEDQPIYTKVKDEPPTRYLKSSSIKQCNGCKWLYN